jgi:iron-sulfur cluster assembly protein
MTLSITAAAADRIRDSIASRGKGIGLRVGVKTSGCSGYMYTIDFADEMIEGDHVFEEHGVKVIVNNDSMTFLDGTEVDFGREGLNEAFKFNNPNATAGCGCGESFSV